MPAVRLPISASASCAISGGRPDAPPLRWPEPSDSQRPSSGFLSAASGGRCCHVRRTASPWAASFAARDCCWRTVSFHCWSACCWLPSCCRARSCDCCRSASWRSAPGSLPSCSVVGGRACPWAADAASKSKDAPTMVRKDDAFMATPRRFPRRRQCAPCGGVFLRDRRYCPVTGGRSAGASFLDAPRPPTQRRPRAANAPAAVFEQV